MYEIIVENDGQARFDFDTEREDEDDECEHHIGSIRNIPDWLSNLYYDTDAK